MAVPVKNALITSFLSKTRDRFHEYHADQSIEERLAMASKIEGISGVEVVHHYEVNDPAVLKTLLARNGLGIAAINANVKAEPEFRNGGVTSTDSAIREKAVGFIKAAKGFRQSRRCGQSDMLPPGRRIRVQLPLRLCAHVALSGRVIRRGSLVSSRDPTLYRIQAKRDPRAMLCGHSGKDIVPSP
jgi:hypothetical protein